MAHRFGTIGGGIFGEMHIRALTQRARRGDIEYVGLADINSELRSARAAEYGIDVFADFNEMLDVASPTAVTIATPDHLHRDIVVACVERGVHVLVEKPMDTDVDGCREMVAAADESGVLLQVDFMKRHDLYHAELKRIVESGGIGDIQYGYAWMEDRIEVPTDWLPSWASNSSPAWFVGVHYFDLIRWLVGRDAVAVSATGVAQRLRSIGIDTYDSIQTKIMFPGGVSFTVDSAWHLPAGNEAIVNQGIKVVGSDGWMTVDSQDRGTRGLVSSAPGAPASMLTPNLGLFKESTEAGLPRYSGYAIDSIESFVTNVAMLERGVADLESLKGAYPSGKDGLEVTKIAVAAHRSVERGGDLVSLGSL
ncbi:Gfo/Idh/MocA family protein [Candidatus Spongiisocius sp.]|uniref:Gfo/Idh/MocA family protein n=1 Tax=Candidatus Spongiisocius sp. TaxID=3101273 RepID=UPI003B5B6C5F